MSVETARQIVQELPKEMEKVGVFVNQAEDVLCELAERAGLTAIQMHGDHEDPHVADVVKARRPELKVLAAISMLHENPDQSDDDAPVPAPGVRMSFTPSSSTQDTVPNSAGRARLSIGVNQSLSWKRSRHGAMWSRPEGSPPKTLLWL